MLKHNRLWLIVRTGWKFAGKHRRALVACTTLYMIAQAIALLEPYVIGLMLNAVQADLSEGAAGSARLFHDVLRYMMIFIGIRAAFWTIHGPTRLLERMSAFHICFNYKAQLYQNVTSLPLKWQRNNHSGQNIDKINRATAALSDFFQGSFELVYMVCRLIGTLLILYWFMPFAAIATLITTVIACGTIMMFDRVLSKQYDELNKLANNIAAALHDYVTNIVTVITLRLENRTLKEVKRRMEIPFALFKNNNLLNECKWFLTSMMIVVMTAVVLIHYVHATLAIGAVLLAGTFFTLFDYLRRIGDSFGNFASYYGRVVRQAADLLSAQSISDDAAAVSAATAGAVLPADWKKISVSGLNFTYEDSPGTRPNLLEVNVELEKGKAIAFVGESGSGKSTMLMLLRGLQSATSVDVRADGIPLEHKLRHLAGTTMLMPQNPEIFADTIRFNITFGMDADDDQVIGAIRAARFETVLSRLPDGLETNIAEKGVNLSGGERQRLALARGIFFTRRSEIILLDEPTSSVDTDNERRIYTTLMTRYRDRCLVSSIHKLHLLELFDTVYVFQDGKIVETGSFAELVEANGVLARLWQNYQSTSKSKQ